MIGDCWRRCCRLSGISVLLGILNFFVEMWMYYCIKHYGYESDVHLMVGVYLILINFLTLVINLYDKLASMCCRSCRIREISLHTLSFLGGAPATALAMIIFCHKKSKRPYQGVYCICTTFSSICTILEQSKSSCLDNLIRRICKMCEDGDDYYIRSQRQSSQSNTSIIGTCIVLAVMSLLAQMWLCSCLYDYGYEERQQEYMGYLFFINLLTIGVNLYDKMAAKFCRGSRICETCLHTFTFFGGAPATALAMIIFNHKSYKRTYQDDYGTAVCASIVCVMLAAYFIQ
uniref:uncharacterized protein LOC113474161 n=1 Tax=Ciona intestinalis TaxID=7719 RepID=UPI000EF4EFE5|nr:uncharacterized protein LOC113474161 [Ciona intestinalis]|eukprot:XP_026689846.1 uncharacterized protein LOC113474161 [Ciona intestinalis]